MSKKIHKKYRGQALIEYVIFIGLAALALAGIIYWATKGRQGASVDKEVSTVTTIVGGTQKLYNQDPNGYANVTAAALISNGIIRPDQVVSGAIVSGFGTPVTVAPSTCYSANDCVDFTYLVPPEKCSDFVQGIATDFAKISVAGTSVKDTTSGQPTVNAATLGTQCSGTSGANVPVVMTATR